MELLSRLFGSAERVKVIRYFLHHEDVFVTEEMVREATKSKVPILKKELSLLTAISFLEKKKTKMYIASGTKKQPKLKEVTAYALVSSFAYIAVLKELLFTYSENDLKELAARFKGLGRIKLFLVSGIFVSDDKARLDILLVGDAFKKPKVEKVFDSISAETGREIRYALMDSEEYEYRIKMYDKFVLDVLEFPHKKIINKF
ncbi:MAG: hypothetical protein RI935_310 [Candidatus Parcubacteria bacterium]|jgi:hypothetical protein